MQRTQITKNQDIVGLECLEYHYKSYDEKDIINFIENVILKDQDPMASKRKEFNKNVLRVNYPHVAQNIIRYIKNQITQ